MHHWGVLVGRLGNLDRARATELQARCRKKHNVPFYAQVQQKEDPRQTGTIARRAHHERDRLTRCAL